MQNCFFIRVCIWWMLDGNWSGLSQLYYNEFLANHIFHTTSDIAIFRF